MEEVKKKRGRPPKEDGRKRKFTILLTDKEYAAIQEAARLSNKNSSEFVRDAAEGEVNYVKLLKNSSSAGN